MQEARVVAETNALCRRSAAPPPAARRSKQQVRATQEAFGALSRALSRAAAYLPAGKDLNEARRARHALFAEESRHATGEPAGPDLRFEKLQLRIYRDEIALGLICDGQVALAARQTEQGLPKHRNRSTWSSTSLADRPRNRPRAREPGITVRYSTYLPDATNVV